MKKHTGHTAKEFMQYLKDSGITKDDFVTSAKAFYEGTNPYIPTYTDPETGRIIETSLHMAWRLGYEAGLTKH